MWWGLLSSHYSRYVMITAHSIVHPIQSLGQLASQRYQMASLGNIVCSHKNESLSLLHQHSDVNVIYVIRESHRCVCNLQQAATQKPASQHDGYNVIFKQHWNNSNLRLLIYSHKWSYSMNFQAWENEFFNIIVLPSLLHYAGGHNPGSPTNVTNSPAWRSPECYWPKHLSRVES